MLTNSDGETEFVVTANGNVGIGSWIADERLTIESNEANREVADVLFRTATSEHVGEQQTELGESAHSACAGRGFQRLQLRPGVNAKCSPVATTAATLHTMPVAQHCHPQFAQTEQRGPAFDFSFFSVDEIDKNRHRF